MSVLWSIQELAKGANKWPIRISNLGKFYIKEDTLEPRLKTYIYGTAANPVKAETPNYLYASVFCEVAHIFVTKACVHTFNIKIRRNYIRLENVSGYDGAKQKPKICTQHPVHLETFRAMLEQRDNNGV